jgi:hypothetical protein
MDPKDIEEMQAGFAAIYGRKAEFADRFYVHLFARMPEAEAMFVGDFTKQKEMFASMLTYCPTRSLAGGNYPDHGVGSGG